MTAHPSPDVPQDTASAQDIAAQDIAAQDIADDVDDVYDAVQACRTSMLA
jgi:hypothetical protein